MCPYPKPLLSWQSVARCLDWCILLLSRDSCFSLDGSGKEHRTTRCGCSLWIKKSFEQILLHVHIVDRHCVSSNPKHSPPALPLQGTCLDRGSACQAQLGLGSSQHYQLTWQKSHINMALLFLIPKLICWAPSPLSLTATDLRHKLQVLANISFTSHTKTSPYWVIHQNYSLWEGSGSLQVTISLRPASPDWWGCNWRHAAVLPELHQERQWCHRQLGVPRGLWFNSSTEHVLH